MPEVFTTERYKQLDEHIYTHAIKEKPKSKKIKLAK